MHGIGTRTLLQRSSSHLGDTNALLAMAVASSQLQSFQGKDAGGSEEKL
jgi:hypothetical protein